MEFPLLGQQVAIELTNTVWVHSGHTMDALACTASAQRWLEAVADYRLSDGSRIADAIEPGLPGTLSGNDLRALVEVRRAVRSLLEACADRRPLPAAALAELTARSAAAPSALRADPHEDGLRLRRHRPGGPMPAILAALAEDALLMIADPATAAVVARCPGPGCLGVFVLDRPRRRYCSPTCGTRARVARHYSRSKAPEG